MLKENFITFRREKTMKTANVLICAVLIFMIPMLTSTSYSMIDPETVIAMWLFDDEDEGAFAADSSGNGHDAELMGGVEWVNQGKFGKAMQFDGIDDYLTPGTVSHPSPNFSVSLWLNMPEALAGWAHIVENGFPEHSWQCAYRIEPGAAEGSFFVATGDGAGIAEREYAAGWKLGEWFNIVYTHDGAKGRLYMNGNEVGDIDAAIDISEATGTLNIGSWEGQNRFYKGLADEIAIFSVALSVDEINDIVVNGLAGVSPVSPAGRLVSTWSHIKSQ
jgi:hypothetical protein